MSQYMGPITANDNDGGITTEQSSIQVHCASIRRVYLLYQADYFRNAGGCMLLIQDE
jgi:hypothetical protein